MRNINTIENQYSYLLPVIVQFVTGANLAAQARNSIALIAAIIDGASTENLLAARENLFAALDIERDANQFVALSNVYSRVETALERRGIAPNPDHYPADMAF